MVAKVSTSDILRRSSTTSSSNPHCFLDRIIGGKATRGGSWRAETRGRSRLLLHKKLLRIRHRFRPLHGHPALRKGFALSLELFLFGRRCCGKSTPPPSSGSQVACITGYSQQHGVVALQGPLGFKHFSGELCVD
ncbi:hypothetical protein MGG_09581 [Pyricularia oryzae 70-15]|uniref:Uncharacterized protein n=1 Tax=Pyricularia oryzae (strain 70-15 / ATCC MYA-4617 / FGSC 8958) TaxID=242507 RepID=G4NLG4_PYRO7|nr:uncharacterized protein MGG_09581 [Pyricularia oryzae 70-15]EHA46765.1 hypothetical protein MGG_09581 [Pyricularia oryzae 70-15]